ncbi:tetratricopeptide repeat protein [Actinokineospora sp. NPDC004072]
MRAPVEPDPAGAASVAELCGRLAALRRWAGAPSYAEIARRVAAARRARGVPETPGRVTVYDCFRPDRTRVDVELLVDIAVALGADGQRWRQAHRAALGGGPPVNVVVGRPDEQPDFVGRSAELARLVGGAGATVITGMPGVGKTRLALLAARRSAAELVVRVDLRGFDAALPPAEPAAALDAVLRALGVPGAEVPPDPQRRGQLYRRLLSERGAVLVLDDAAGREQVEPLLPGGATRVLITSRRGIAGLDALALAPFHHGDSLALLAAAAPERVAAEGEDALRIAALCGHLPLELAVAAAGLAQRPDWSLDDHAHRLAALPRGESPALHASYRALGLAEQAVFRAVVLHPGRTITPAAAAALAGRADVSAELARLADEHLLLPGYRFHDLVREHALRRAVDEDPLSGRRAAVARLLDHYADALADAEPGWTAAELPNLVAAALHAAEHGYPDHLDRLSEGLAPYLDATARHDEAAQVHGHAARLADPAARCRGLGRLARVHEQLGSFAEALALHRDALAIAERIGDRPEEAALLSGMGNNLRQLGRYTDAHAAYTRSLAVAERAGDVRGIGRATGNLADLCRIRGHYTEAEAHGRRALAAFTELGETRLAGVLHSNLGVLANQRGRPDLAVEHLDTALECHRLTLDRATEARSTVALGTALRLLGRPHEALARQRAGLALARENGVPDSVATALTAIGSTLHALGRTAEAAEHHREALAVAEAIGDREAQAEAHAGLGELGAADHRARAAALAGELGDRALIERVAALR